MWKTEKVCYGYTHNWQIPYGFLSSLPWMGKVYKVFIHVHIVVGVVDHCWRLLRNKNETIREYEKYTEQPLTSLYIPPKTIILIDDVSYLLVFLVMAIYIYIYNISSVNSKLSFHQGQPRTS